MITTKICPICKNDFERKYNSQKYCSSNCSNIARAKSAQKPERTFVCQCCGKDFKSVRKRKYCDPACRDYSEGRLPKVKKVHTKTLSV